MPTPTPAEYLKLLELENWWAGSGSAILKSRLGLDRLVEYAREDDALMDLLIDYRAYIRGEGAKPTAKPEAKPEPEKKPYSRQLFMREAWKIAKRAIKRKRKKHSSSCVAPFTNPF